MAWEAQEELVTSLSKLLFEGAYSDLTITTTEDVFEVHKAVVCPRSPFFEKACSNASFKEAIYGIVELRDDDPQDVARMIHYFYRLDYPDQVKFEDVSEDAPDIEKTIKGKTESLAGAGDQKLLRSSHRKGKFKRRRLAFAETTHHNSWGLTETGTEPTTAALLTHVRMYALGEKYGARGLKALALAKFRGALYRTHGTDGLAHVIEEVYTSTICGDRGMRDVVVDAFVHHRRYLDIKEVQDSVKTLELCFDLMMRFRGARPSPTFVLGVEQPVDSWGYSNTVPSASDATWADGPVDSGW